MDSGQVRVLLAQAEVQRRLGNHRFAAGLIQRALTMDPDHAIAHAALAFVLLDERRLAGAGIEVRLALALDADEPYVHRVAAAVLSAERKLDDAWAHCLIALQSDAPPPEAFVIAAAVRMLQGDRGQARELLLGALALDAAHTAALTQLARLELASGHRDEAARLARLAVESDPNDRAAHVIAGHIDLARGDLASAEHHARFVLQARATDPGGLGLWSEIQARRSWLLGAWWRLNTWVSLGAERRRLGLLLAGYLVAQLAIIVSDELGLDRLTLALALGWIGLCAYTWFAPVVFRRMVARSLKPVRLDPRF